MNNAILFFYKLNISELKKINENYYFTYNNENYIVERYKRRLEEVIELYQLNIELTARKIPTYKIILTANNDILFKYKEKFYIMMRIPKIKNRFITYKDIEMFNIIPSAKYQKIDKTNWSYNWSKKIDYIEYQFNQVKNKYKIINLSIDYYIGMWENAISYYNDHNITNNKTITHKRITIDTDLLDFLNPLNLVIDFKERDIGEYLKSYVLNKNYGKAQLTKILEKINKKNSAILLISRILFPSYYFDIYDEIVIGGENESAINEIITKQKNINSLISYMFEYFYKYNITRINWIKKDEN